jgi:hypothetical protein
MKTLVTVDAGICGFKTRIHADSEDSQNVTFCIVSACKKVQEMADFLISKGPVDGYAEIGAGSEGVILATARKYLNGCCAGCAVSSAVFKAMQVAAGLALPKDITIKITKE